MFEAGRLKAAPPRYLPALAIHVHSGDTSTLGFVSCYLLSFLRFSRCSSCCICILIGTLANI